MNKVILVGRLTKDPELKNTASQIPFCNFTVAVDRKFKDQSGQKQADFINCVAWRQTASFIGSYFHKGSKIGIVGSIQSRTYDDSNGQKKYVTEVLVDEAEFIDSANSNKQQSGQAYGGAPSAPAAPSAPSAPASGTMASSAPLKPSEPLSVPDEGPDGGSDSGMSLPFEM